MLNQQPPLDLVFHALADPSRRGMVERLSRGPASVSELAKPFAMSLPAVVQHLQVLEASGLVRTEKVGRVRTCQIVPEALSMAERWINDRRTLWERRLDRLGIISGSSRRTGRSNEPWPQDARDHHAITPHPGTGPCRIQRRRFVEDTTGIDAQERWEVTVMNWATKDSLARHTPQALAILRIVTGVLFIHSGVLVLFNIPASVYPPPPPEMSTLMTIAGVLELAGGRAHLPWVFDPTVAFLLCGMMAVAIGGFHFPMNPWPANNLGVAAILYCFIFF